MEVEEYKVVEILNTNPYIKYFRKDEREKFLSEVRNGEVSVTDQIENIQKIASNIHMQEMKYGDNHQKVTKDISVEELKMLAEKVKIAREEYDKASKAQKEASELKSLLESKMLDALEEADLMRFDAHDVMFLVSNKTSAKTPKSPEEKELFFNYLREQGVYEDMITVNSNTLNSYVKTEEALATERGELDFSIPGIAIDYYKQLSVRKK